jgi:hypothetical protein
VGQFNSRIRLVRLRPEFASSIPAWILCSGKARPSSLPGGLVSSLSLAAVLVVFLATTC